MSTDVTGLIESYSAISRERAIIRRARLPPAPARSQVLRSHGPGLRSARGEAGLRRRQWQGSRHTAGLYEGTDALREEASARLALAARQDGGTVQSRQERDAAMSRYAQQLARIGLRDETRAGEALLVGWRAPVVRAFYLRYAS